MCVTKLQSGKCAECLESWSECVRCLRLCVKTAKL